MTVAAAFVALAGLGAVARGWPATNSTDPTGSSRHLRRQRGRQHGARAAPRRGRTGDHAARLGHAAVRGVYSMVTFAATSG